MSTPRLDPGIPAEAPSAGGTEGLHTALIKQFAGEFFSGGVPAAPASFSPFPAVHSEPVGVNLPAEPAGLSVPLPAEAPVSPAVFPGVSTALPGGVTSFSGIPSEASSDTAVVPKAPDKLTPALPASGPDFSMVTPQVVGAPAPASGDQLAPVHPATLSEPPSSHAFSPSVGGHDPSSPDVFAFGEPRSNGLHDSTRTDSSAAHSASAGDAVASSPGLETPGEAPSYYFLTVSEPRHNPILSTPASRSTSTPVSAFDVEAVRRDFPALHQLSNGHPLVYLDNAATTQKPQAVLDATSLFYARDNANIHRAAYDLAERATAAFENGREKVRQFLGAGDKHEIIFVRGTTEGINLVAQTYGKKFIGQGDEIILSELEHHANIVPWQLLAEQVGAVLRVIPINDRGELILEEYVKLFNARTKIVSVAHVSNSLGTVNPVETIIPIAHAHGVPVLVDGAQSTPHLPVNVQALDADFYVFSGHKIFGPTGIGVVYGKKHWLETIPPYQGGGHMIKDVRFEKTIFQHPPEKFEAGTPDIVGVVGLGAAIDYLFNIGIPSIAAYEHSLLEYATAALATIPGLRPIGTAANKASVLSFVIPGLSNDSIAKHLDRRGIAVRAGHHCSLPAQRHFGLESTVRPSLAFYNNREDVDALVEGLRALKTSAR
ncbi:MAG: SufS family cysteine desulfurase [Terrimicrobiaceae bacterium]